MSSRPQFNPYVVYPSQNASPASTSSMTTSFTTEPTIVQKLSQISYEFVWTGTPTGFLSVQGSNDFSISPGGMGNIQNPGTWTSLILSYNGGDTTNIPITGTNGNGIIDIASTGLYAIRVMYTATSGTGSMTTTISAKVA